MPRLSFNQKVWSGIAGILVLLFLSGINSLFNLNDIEASNDRVSNTAVPVVAVANEAQIQLLKLATLTASSNDAESEDDIKSLMSEFSDGSARFDDVMVELQAAANDDPELSPIVDDVRANYSQYNDDVKVMFAAKMDALVAKATADEEAETVLFMVDDVGQVFADIMNFIPPPELAKQHALASGSANQADMYNQNITRLIQETTRATDVDAISTYSDDAIGELENVMVTFDVNSHEFEAMDDDGLVKKAHELADRARERINRRPNFVELKMAHLELVKTADEKMDTAKASVQKSVDGLDALLKKSTTVFNSLQAALADSVSFGFKSTGIFTAFLLGLALVVFLSMLNAIRRKMSDLAQLNRIGGGLASSRDQESALAQVLNAMSEKIGIQSGSVYLFNSANELEARAFLPPRIVPAERKAVTFTMGEGIIGRAADTRKTIFVPDTSREKSYVTAPGDQPKALLCVPLLDGEVLVGVMNLSGEIKRVRFADSDYEFVSTVAHSLVTTIKNIRMVEQIEEHNRDLEKKVAERTKELRQKNDDIANMLQNMNQGLFTIIEGGLIHPEYAAYLEQIFETENIANRNAADLLFANSTLSTDAKDSAITSIASIVGEDSMMYEFNSHLLVRECAVRFDGRPEKLLEFDWNPIKNDDDVVIKLMVTVRDVTALRALQAEAEAQKQELSIIAEILAVDVGKFEEFIHGSAKFIRLCRDIISTTAEKNLDRISELFRNMHTVKGNARTYGFKLVTEVVHEVENTYDALRKQEEKEWEPESLLSELKSAEDIVSRYREVAFVKLGRDGKAAQGGRLDPEMVTGLIRKITSLTTEHLPEAVTPIFNEARRLQATLEGKPLDTVIGDVIKSVKSLALELKKAEPTVDIDSGGVYIRDEHHGMLNNIFMHLLRNAMDHGIESPEDRVAKGKAPAGCISVSTEQAGGKLRISVSDDGRGIAIARIFRKSVENGLYPAGAPRPAASAIANLIFASGFSTAEQVTEVSGRGVGMDAVRKFLESEGGSIDVVLLDGDEADDFRPFRIEVTLPAGFFFAPMPLSLVS